MANLQRLSEAAASPHVAGSYVASPFPLPNPRADRARQAPPSRHPAAGADRTPPRAGARERYAASALAPATRRSYERDWRLFATWCAERGLVAIPAEPATVAAFLAAEADRGFRPVTAGAARRRSPPRTAPQDHPNPCDSGAVAAVMSGIRREHGTKPLRRAAPLELEPLARLIELIDTATLAGLRDRALLLLGFAAAMRRSELVALDVEDLEFDAVRGLKLTIGKSKTDQEQAGAQVAVPYARASDGRAALVRRDGDSVLFAGAYPVERDGEVGADAGLGDHRTSFGIDAEPELDGYRIWGEGAKRVDHRFGGRAGGRECIIEGLVELCHYRAASAADVFGADPFNVVDVELHAAQRGLRLDECPHH